MSTLIKGIECFGNMSEDATVMLQCECSASNDPDDWNEGDQFEQMYSGSKGFTTWYQLIDYYVIEGAKEGYIIVECESDE